ncbi:zinc finger protein 541 isoform X2 [Dendropsophus ebraccatus]|uniref:zinc finger protein 541 isoform X2 n=1 Tax=Dendropsophus ebraccatus TaxID=150705 RepID=UPI003831F15D
MMFIRALLADLKMDLYRDDFSGDTCPPVSDFLQPLLPDPSSSSAAAVLSDNLGNNKWEADLGLFDGSMLLPNKPCKEKATVLDCKVCGKVFSSASSLNKHIVTHSMERSHICKVCKKAFKRQDHLVGHMLTHLKIKPFACTESGCSKSYCNFRSLRRHCEVHHGLLTKQQQGPCLIPSKDLETASTPPVMPNSGIIGGPVTQFLQQKLTSNMVVMQSPTVNQVPQMMTSNSSTSNEAFANMNTYTSINSNCQVSNDPDYVRYPRPSADNSLWNLLILQSQKIQSMQDQQNSYLTRSIDEATVNGGYKESSAGYLNNKHMAIYGHEPIRVQYSQVTQGADFTRLTLQPSQNSEFQVQNPANFFLAHSQPERSQTAPLGLPIMSIHQCIPQTSGTRGFGDLRRDPQGGTPLSRIIGAAENVTNKIQAGPAKDQPRVTGQGSQQPPYSKSERLLKLGTIQCMSAMNKDKLWFDLSSIGSLSQRPPESYKCQGNERMDRLSISSQGDDQKVDMGIQQHKVEATVQSLETGSWTTKDTRTAGHLVIPVSVPFSEKGHQGEDKVIGIRNPPEKYITQEGKKIRPYPKPLYIPPPVEEKNATPLGFFQSSMRSPHTPISDCLHHVALQPQYTPPPMLSPTRRGTGLYFNTFSSASSTKYHPPSLVEKDTGGICLVKDSIEFSVQPHINIGDQFQAVIPECRGHSGLEREEEKADLVWRPCLNTEEMSNFVNLACSSAVPGGGCNLELSLHCLHFSQGNVMEALDKLLMKEPLKLLPRCLADYHYAGSDHWSAAEKRQFKKAYSKERKNFSYIQSVISEKSVYQCVEYYYTWKNMIGFKRHQAQDQALSTEQRMNGDEPHEGKPDLGVTVKSKETPICSQKETGDWEYSIKFVCQECNRVFDKMKSRNAHMKKHRQQEQKIYCLVRGHSHIP